MFVDIVGLSDSQMSVKTQVKKINVLHKCIKDCTVFRSVSRKEIIMIPTGDGLALGFLKGPDMPLQMSIELHKKLLEYNMAKIPSETVFVRIGLHSGNVFVVDDLFGKQNFWGPGIVLARRIMDIGDEGDILLSSRYAEDLLELTDEYKKIIHPLGTFDIKHGQTVSVYCAYGEDFGNKTTTKNSKHVNTVQEQIKIARFYPHVEVNLSIKNPKTMLVHHKRIYEMVNVSDTPITRVSHGIATDVSKPGMKDLKINVYDEKKHKLKISQIKLDTPYQKEFITQFNRPILQNEKGRKYVLEYSVEEPHRYFENAFLLACKSFVLNFIYPTIGFGIKPILYDVNQETEQKSKSEIRPIIKKNNKQHVTSWRMENVVRGQTVRIEW